MAENRPLLILRLEGAMQSWGESSKWDTRDTAIMPTKSGVIGLLACALGLPRGDERITALYDAVQVAVRTDRQGSRMVDYHTVTGEPLRNAEGKPRSTGNTFISHRDYWQDASFLVVIEAECGLLEQLKQALLHPKWCLYLGRKSCVPSRPVFEALTYVYTSSLDAIQRYPAAPRAQYPMLYECESASPQAAALTRPDGKPAAGTRRFARRWVWRSTVKEEAHVSDEN